MHFYRNLWIFSICVTFVFAFRNDHFLNQSMNDDSSVLSNIIGNLLVKHFKVDEIYLSIILPSLRNDKPHFFDDFISKIFKHFTLERISHSIINRFNDSVRYKRSFYLIFIDDSNSLLSVLNTTTVKDFNLQEEFLIIQIGSVKNTIEALDGLFAILWRNGLLRSNVLIQESTKTWSLHAFVPYQMDCFTLTRLKLGSFPSFHSNVTDQLYFPILEGFNKCHLYFGVFRLSPFIIFRNLFGKIEFDGIYISIINQISRTLNFTAVYKIYLPKKHDPKGPFDTPFLNSVANGETNASITVFTTEEDLPMVPSNPLLYFPFQFVYKETDSYIEYLIKRFLAPFTTTVWLVGAAILILAIVVLLQTKKLTRKRRHFVIGGWMNRSPILNMWAIVLGNAIFNTQIVRQQFYGTFSRTLVLMWIILWLVVRNSYQGALYNYLQGNQFTSPFDTVEKVNATNCKIISSRVAYNMMKHLFKPERLTYENTEQMSILKEFYDTFNGSTVLLVNEISVKYFNLLYYPERYLARAKDRIYMQSALFYFRKRSILRRLFNEKLIRIREAGLVEFWIRQYTENIKLKPKRKKPKNLQLENVLGIFQICTFTYIFIGIVFILEMISGKVQRVQYVLDYITY